MKPYHFLFSIAAIGLLVVIFGGLFAQEHGVNLIKTGPEAYLRTYRWAWLYLDGASFGFTNQENTIQNIQLTGYLWQGQPGQTTWRIAYDRTVEVRVDGQVIFTGEGNGQPQYETVDLTWAGDSLFLEVEYAPELSGESPPQPTLAIYEPGFLGSWELLPAHRLYTDPPDPTTATREEVLFVVTRLAFWGMVGLVGAGIITIGWRRRIFQRREFWLITFLIGLGLGVRLILMSDRSTYDPQFLWITPGGDDNYPLMARLWLSGAYDLGETFWQPGNILWISGLTALFGPDLHLLYGVSVLVSGLTIGAMYGAVRILGNPRAAGIAALLMALYPPLIFYQVSLQTAPMDIFLVTAALWVGAAALRRPRLYLALLFGMLSGWLILFRGSTIGVFVALILTLLIYYRRFGGLTLTRWIVATLLATLFVLLPQLYINAASGEFSLTSTNGWFTLYGGNNRDSDGTWPAEAAQRGMAFDYALQSDSFRTALLTDLSEDPLRMVLLNLRKIGLFWDNRELMHNIDYESQGLHVSPVLNLLSLGEVAGMALLSLLGWAGMFYSFIDAERRKNPSSLFLLLATALIMLGITAFIITGRLRSPVIPVLIVGAALFLDRVITRRKLHLLGLSLGCSLLLTLGMNTLADTLPPPPFFDHLPQTAQERVNNYGDAIEMVGFDPIKSDHLRDSQLYVTVYWRALRELDVDYRVSLQLLNDDLTKVAATDVTLGTVGYPNRKTSTWPVGQILREGYRISIPADCPPVTKLVAIVYDEATQTALPLDADNNTFGLLTSFGVVDPAESAALTPTEWDWFLGQDQLVFANLKATASADTLFVTGVMMARQPLMKDYVVFIHLYDSADQWMAQDDGQILSGDWRTSALVPGYTVVFGQAIPLEDGEIPQRIDLGLYDGTTEQRLAVVDAQGNSLPNGIIPLPVETP